VRGDTVTFRLLHQIAELQSVEDLQREAFGVTDRDMLAASELVVVPETGGTIVGAFAQDGEFLGAVVGWGGYAGGRPRIVSDFMAVRQTRRSGGIGTEMKKLQAAVALARGFVEIVWTVEPLRAANAWLNFEKLGAFADRYEENRYGAGFGAALYGDLPTDRLHLTWPITTAAVRERLLGTVSPQDIGGAPIYDPAINPDRALVLIPSDIDAVLASDPAAALEWRLRLRETLQGVFAAGYRIVGFVSGIDRDRGLSAYVIERPDR
jgi:predicted GNAT superfamily acetyltransferase